MRSSVRLIVRGLACSFSSGVQLLRDVDLDLNVGEFVVLFGLNGVGKSTLLRTIAGLREPSAGEIKFDPPSNDPPARHIGYVMQNPDVQLLAPTVEEEIALGLELRGVPPSEMRPRVEAILSRFDLTSLRDRTPSTLSGGQKQRVVLAAILISEPSFLLLDEPDSYLDAPSRRSFFDMIDSIRSRYGILWTTADPEKMPDADRYLRLENSLLRASTRDELLSASLSDSLRVISLALQSVDFSWTNREGRIPALRGVSFSVSSDLPMYLCGPSGSGKTTLAMLCAGFNKPDSGSLAFHPEIELPNELAFVFQFPEDLFIEDTVAEEAAQLIGSESDASLREHFSAFGLDYDRLAPLSPVRLSAAEGRLTAIALQIARRPRLLILDEPTIGLDPRHRRKVIAALKSTQTPDRLLIIVTHDLALLREFPGTALVLADGGLAWQGPTEFLLADNELLRQSKLIA